MSARDLLFHYETGAVVHLFRGYSRFGPPRAIPACAARSYAEPVYAWFTGFKRLPPCPRCHQSVKSVAAAMDQLKKEHETDDG